MLFNKAFNGINEIDKIYIGTTPIKFKVDDNIPPDITPDVPPDYPKPDKVINLRSIETTSTSVLLAWDYTGDRFNLKGFNIFKDGQPFTTVNADITQFKITELNSYTIYGFKVQSMGINGVNGTLASISIRTPKDTFDLEKPKN